jgi:hypothetical protein
LLFEDKKSAKRYILKDGYLVNAPKSPGGFITTSLLFLSREDSNFSGDATQVFAVAYDYAV